MRALRPRRRWAVLIPVGMALGYAGYEGIFQVQSGSAHVTADALLSLIASNRVQTFLVVPAWLIGCAFAIASARQPPRLLRLGSWRRTVFRPLAECLATFGIASAATAIGWILILGTVHGDLGTETLAAGGALGGEILLLAAVLSAVYFVMSAVHLVAGPAVGLVAVPAVAWVWLLLSNIGVTQGSVFDASRYFSVIAVARDPASIAVIVGALVVLGALAWLVADRWDALVTTADRWSGRYGLELVGLALSLVGALGMGRDQETIAAGLHAVFLGAGGSIAQYLLGVSILLIPGTGTVLALSNELTHRAPIVLIRFGSLRRWLASFVGARVIRMAVYLTAVVVLVAGTRWVAFGRPAPTVDDALVALGLCLHLAATGLLFIAAGTVCTIVFRSGTAGIGALAALLVIGMIPVGGSPFNPVTTWSASWWTLAELPAALTAAVSVVLCIAALLVSSRERRVGP